ncbi:MAG: adenylyl-sulfate kinase, partial [Maricaulis sp.]|nr:adenylyl-sulfate kinase [Maricaulis sp.]
VLTQTLRHTYIAHMMGIRHLVLAVNKMDLVDWSCARFHSIVADYMKSAENLGFESITAIPMSARFGENVRQRTDVMDWYTGPILLEHLESLDIETGEAQQPLRFPVQWVNRPNLNFRGYAGTVASGSVSVGDDIVVASSGAASRVSRIVTSDGDLETAAIGDAVTLVLEGEIDIARGDVLVPPQERPDVSDQFAAELLWMHEDEMLPGRSYLLKIGSHTVPATITSLKHRVDINTFEKKPSRTLEMNGIGSCKVSTSRPIAFEPYKTNRAMGAFVLIDRFTNQTVGAGMIEFGLRRASNIHQQAMDVSKDARAKIKGQKPTLLWFTGLSGAGKSTVANAVESKLAEAGHHTYSLDGDNVRHGLNRDLGFTDLDRVENIRRIGEVGKLMLDAGLLVTCSFISPFRSERQMARDLVEGGEFIEVFVDTPLDVCIERDPKGLYKKALAGEIKNFTGFDSPYEAPETPELRLNTAELSVEGAADKVIAYLREANRLG